MMTTSVSFMAVQEGLIDLNAVIPGHRTAMNPESRDSGFAATPRPE
jgi:hypothetical protein